MSAAAWAQGTGPQGQVGPDSSPVCGWGCLAQPGVPVGLVWGLGPRRLLEPSEGSTGSAPAPNAPRPLQPSTGEGVSMQAPSWAWKPVPACAPRSVWQGRQAMPSPVFVFLVRRGHENLPRKSIHECELAGHATLIGGAGHDSMLSVPGHLPMRGAPNPQTVPQMGKPRPSEESICPGLSGGLGQDLGHVHCTHPHMCSNTYTLAPLCAHTHSCTGTSRQEGPHPSSPPLGTPTPAQSHTLDHETQP